MKLSDLILFIYLIVSCLSRQYYFINIFWGELCRPLKCFSSNNNHKIMMSRLKCNAYINKLSRMCQYRRICQYRRNLLAEKFRWYLPTCITKLFAAARFVFNSESNRIFTFLNSDFFVEWTHFSICEVCSEIDLHSLSWFFFLINIFLKFLFIIFSLDMSFLLPK